MNNPQTVVASLALSIFVAAGITAYWGQSQTDLEPESDATSEQRITELEREIATLRDGLARVANGAAPMRERTETVDPATIEAAVAKWMKTNATPATAKKGAPADDPTRLNMERTYQLLLATDSEAEMTDLWAKLRKAGQVKEMVKRFEEFANNRPEDAEAQVQLGVAYCFQLQGMTPGIETGRIANKADQTFDKALAINPKHWDARFTKATALSFWPPMFGKQAEAISHFEILRTQQEESGDRAKKNAQTYLLLGNLYSQQGKKEKATEIWTRGLRYFPNHKQLTAKTK